LDDAGLLVKSFDQQLHRVSWRSLYLIFIDIPLDDAGLLVMMQDCW
jgi:hypothetical protein